jgi:hypothetical protein
MSEHLLRSLSTADALGRSLVVRKDEVFSGDEYVAAKDYGEWFVCDDGPVSVSFDIIPQWALEILKKRSISIAGIESDELKNAVRDILVRSIEEGKTFKEFGLQVDLLFDSYGVDRIDIKHLQTVFRTNIFAVYSIAKYEQVKEMQDRFPLIYFSAIHDSKSRHIPLEGYYKIGSAPLAPVDYNCRCSDRYIHISEITGNEVVFESIPRPDLIRFDQRDSLP